MMTGSFLEKIFQHKNWANQKIIQACYAWSDEQLDAGPQSATKGTIRRTLTHPVHSQLGYLSLLTMPVDQRPDFAPTFAELWEAARIKRNNQLSNTNFHIGWEIFDLLRRVEKSHLDISGSHGE